MHFGLNAANPGEFGDSSIVAAGKLFDRIWGYLKGRRHVYIPTTMLLPPLDPIQIKDELQIDRRGRERGARNQPTADSKTFDEVENEIVTLIERHRESAASLLRDDLSTYAERLNSLDLDGVATNIAIEARTVLSDFSTALSHGADRAYAARRHFVELNRHVTKFKQDARLDRPAHYPASRILHFGVLLALLAVEAVLNGIFLGETHMLGLLGGFTEAIVIAVVNVGLGAFVGFAVLRQCWHRAFCRKLIGALGVILYLALILGFNLVVSHYRDALSSGDWDTATTTALQTIVANPLGVADIKSWLLFLVGVFFSLIALIDGFRMDDPYPGYGPRDRQLRGALEHYRRVKERCLDNLSEIRADAVDDMRQTKDQLAKARGEYASILEARQRCVERYKQHLEGLEKVGNTLLTAYRDANMAHRTEPAPKHFKERWVMQIPTIPVSNEIDLRKVETSVQQANAALEKEIERVHAEYDKAVRAFKRIEELSEEELAHGSAKEILTGA